MLRLIDGFRQLRTLDGTRVVECIRCKHRWRIPSGMQFLSWNATRLLMNHRSIHQPKRESRPSHHLMAWLSPLEPPPEHDRPMTASEREYFKRL